MTILADLGEAAEHPVTVVIPARSRPRELRRAIESVLAQTRPPAEVVVVDDGSPEPLEPAVSDLSDGLRVLRYEKSVGAGAARNKGAAAATHDWIAFLDSDDEWAPEKLELQLAWASEGVAVVSDYVMAAKHERRVVRIPSAALRVPAASSALSPITVLVHRNDLDRAGGFPQRRDCAEDWVLFARLLATSTSIHRVAEPLATYHWTPDSSTASHRARVSHVRGAIEELWADRRLSVEQRTAVKAVGLARIAEIEANEGHLLMGLTTAAEVTRGSPATGLRALAKVPVSYVRGKARRTLAAR